MTLPSRASQLLSHTVPQALLTHTSTLPSRSFAPPISRTSPSEQPLKLVVKAEMKVDTQITYAGAVNPNTMF